MVVGSYEYYKQKAAPAIKQDFKLASAMAVPRLHKIVLNMGVGAAKENKNLLTNALNELTLISGQKALATKAKKAISQFKIRKDMEIGAAVTLRGKKMYDFFCRLIHVAIPRVRDFNGLSRKSFDQHGNYTFSLKEQIVFPEIVFDKVDKICGLNITIVTTTDSREMALRLLELMGMPFKKK
ncbi:MAG: 50S ribosomal protein L5 [Spirochaetes bacterium GWF1_41_5]|nr:MAG: 50S ribosomal protein L5 [Spirochaetes bacterium GWF1_41_5]HBE03492.1 50S ribosomal protein L5 [Spirochaetia bacterium]